jgi:hypothetical protein
MVFWSERKRLNPGASTVTSHIPTGNWGNVKFPVEVVTVFTMLCVSPFSALTRAPATIAPDGSVTVPVIIPRSA